MKDVKKDTRQIKESFSENIGIRLTPLQKMRYEKWAIRLNLTPAVFARSLLLNKMDELEKEHGKII